MEIWADKINDFYRAKLVANKHFLDMSSDVTGGGDVINIPNLSEMSANAKSNATAVTLNSAQETDVNLTVDQWYEVSFQIEDEEKSQVAQSYNIQSRYARNAGYTVANKLEVALTSLFSAFSNSVGDSNTSVVDSTIRKAISYLDANDVPDEDRAFFFDPSVLWDDIMAIDKFTLLDEAGRSPVTDGSIGMLYGIPVYKTSNIQTVDGGKANALAQKEALAFATAPLPGAQTSGIRLQSNYIPEYLATLVTADILYGCIENRDAAGVYINSAV